MPFFHSDTILFHYLDQGKGVPLVFQLQRAIERFFGKAL